MSYTAHYTTTGASIQIDLGAAVLGLDGTVEAVVGTVDFASVPHVC